MVSLSGLGFLEGKVPFFYWLIIWSIIIFAFQKILPEYNTKAF